MADTKVAALQTALERPGMADDTIGGFTADHGEMMGERGMWYKQHFFEWASHTVNFLCAKALVSEPCDQELLPCRCYANPS